MARKTKSLTDQIRRAVDDCGVSRYAICKVTGIDKSVMSRFMAGKGFLSERSVNRLAVVARLRIVADK
jgi:hypothetical protein